jgi:hypothetical protein
VKRASVVLLVALAAAVAVRVASPAHKEHFPCELLPTFLYSGLCRLSVESGASLPA